MKTRVHPTLAVVLFALVQTPTTVAAKSTTAPDLATSRERIRNADNKKWFDYEMGNTDESPAKLCEKLPDGLGRDALLSALLGRPAERISTKVRVGAVPHPGLPGVHVVWAYLPFDFVVRAPRLYLGLLKGEARDAVNAGQWLSEPIRDMELARDEAPLAFDFAGYPLGKLGRAFGLRTLTHGCGAGGSICSATNLLLFVSLEGRLTKVFDAQVAYFGNLGGAWNEDGSREHIVEESTAIVRLKGGHGKNPAPPVIEKVLVGGRAKQTWTWQPPPARSNDEGAPPTSVDSPGWYGTQDPEFLGTVDDEPPNRPAHRFAPPRTLAYVDQLALPAWHGLGAMPGVAGQVNAGAVGPRGELYVGGAFEFAGEVPARNIAVWDGKTWSALGAGIEQDVLALSLDRSGKLYVACTHFVSVWNGTAWAMLGKRTSEQLIALVVDGAGKVYRASQDHVSMWNGSDWAVLANGWEGRQVRVMTVDGAGRLYAGGWAGRNRSSNLAVWDGSQWSSVGGGTDNFISSLAADRTGKLYVGGRFEHAGEAPIQHLAIWADGAWQSGNLGQLDPHASVDTVRVDPQGGVYVAGNLKGLGPGMLTQRWDGSSWSTPPAFPFVFDGKGGAYTKTGSYGDKLTALRRWDGATGTLLGNGLDEQPARVATAGPDELFIATTFNDVKKSTVARWKNGVWSDLHCPLHRVEALTVDSAGSLLAGGRLPNAPGTWTFLGNWPPIAVFRWDGKAWSVVAQQKLGSILAVAADNDGNLYVAGQFTTMMETRAMGIARWNGRSWVALGDGISDGRGEPGRATALATDAKGNLYAAGELATAGGAPARNVAKWDGQAWSALGEGAPFPVRALAVARTGQVYVGDSGSNVLAWDGQAWSAMAPRMTPQIAALATDATGAVYGAGTVVKVEDRLTCGGIPSEADKRVGQVVKWTGGAWSTVGIFDAAVRTLAIDPTGGVYVAGPFLSQGGRPVGHVARERVQTTGR
jgi:hypothetical protein